MYEAWVIISENNSALCELVSKPEPTIWDDDADMPAKPEETAASTSAGSGTKPEDEKQQVTASVSSTSPLNKEEFKALMANMQELEEAEALVVEPEAPPSSEAAPVEKRCQRAKNKIDPAEYAKEDPYLQKVQQIIAEDEEEDELVSAEYLKQLIDAHERRHDRSC